VFNFPSPWLEVSAIGMALFGFFSKPKPSAQVKSFAVDAAATPKNPQDKLGDPLYTLTPDNVDRDYRTRINRGELAIPTWALHEALRLSPILGNYQRLWLDRIQGLGWSIKTVADPAKKRGAADEAKTPHEILADSQAEALRRHYEGLDVTGTVKHLALANLYGFSFLTKHPAKLEPMNWWNFARVGLYGAWKYNPQIRIQDGKNLPEELTINSDDYVCRVVEQDCLLEYLRIYLRSNDCEGYWDNNLEKESRRQVVIIPGDGLDAADVTEFETAAKLIAKGNSGCLAAGSGDKTTQVLFPPESRGLPYFENRLKVLSEWACQALFGSSLIANTASDSGTLAGNAHADTADDRVNGAAADISKVLQAQVDLPLLRKLGLVQPGQPALAYFELSKGEETNPDAEIDRTAKLASVGFQREVSELREVTGMNLTKAAPENKIIGSPNGDPNLNVNDAGLGNFPKPEPVVADVAATALNGAQVTSLVDVVTQVATKQIPIETARIIIKSAFPMLTDEAIQAMLNPLANFTPAAPDQPAGPGESILNRAADELSVPVKWLEPVRALIDEIVAKAEGGELSEEDLTNYIESAARRIPEIFGEMDIEAFAKFLEGLLGSAAFQGVADAIKR